MLIPSQETLNTVDAIKASAKIGVAIGDLLLTQIDTDLPDLSTCGAASLFTAFGPDYPSFGMLSRIGARDGNFWQIVIQTSEQLDLTMNFPTTATQFDELITAPRAQSAIIVIDEIDPNNSHAIALRITKDPDRFILTDTLQKPWTRLVSRDDLPSLFADAGYQLAQNGGLPIGYRDVVVISR